MTHTHDHDHEHGGHECRCGRTDAVQDLVAAVSELVCGCGCRHRSHEDCGHHGDHGGHGGHDGDGHDGRPTREPGTSTGGLDTPLTPGDLHHPPKPGEWKGPRKDMHLPYLFMRAFPGDTGTRPTTQPFWESPDVYILGGVHPAVAPDVPAQLGQTALAGQDNTVYGHIWNLGHAPARAVVVEFYWCDPSLGFNPVGAHLIGTTTTWLGSRSDPDCHKVVKCPTSWQATFTNGGHECLLVRAFDVAADPMTTPEWDASVNRHLGQRNIHVIPPGQSAGGPLALAVGQLFGGTATVTVARQAPATMPWLQLHTMQRGQFPGQAVGTGDLVLGTPGRAGGTEPVTATGDGEQVLFATGDAPPPAGQAHVYRVTAEQDGAIIGGYTVVHLG
jgi:hypothetical protein